MDRLRTSCGFRRRWPSTLSSRTKRSSADCAGYMGHSVRRRDSLQTSAGGGSWGTWTKRFATILAGHPNSPRWPLAAARDDRHGGGLRHVKAKDAQPAPQDV